MCLGCLQDLAGNELGLHILEGWCELGNKQGKLSSQQCYKRAGGSERTECLSVGRQPGKTQFGASDVALALCILLWYLLPRMLLGIPT